MTFVLEKADLAKTEFRSMQKKKAETSLMKIAPWQVRANVI
jgi:hypothetical protein